MLWFLFLPILAWLVYVPFIRPRIERWGATDAEVTMPLPGDDIAPQPVYSATRAIHINAAPAEIWPWLAQIGQERGGFYSYSWLENLIGMGIENADQIRPEWTERQVGDRVSLAKGNGPFFTVAEVMVDHALVLKGDDGRGMTTSWVFVLLPQDAGGTRLVVRTRYQYPRTLLNWLMWRALLEPGHFVMEERMLRGIKQRAESA